MSDYTRFAIYYLPAPGPLAEFGAAWFGWDVVAGRTVSQLVVPEVDLLLTQTPSRYGFHATLKPPFRLRDGATQSGLQDAVAELARRTAPGQCDELALTPLGRFVALTGLGDMAAINRIAAACVTDLDPFRAPLSQTELDRRQPDRLTPQQLEMLHNWGYPHVLECFRFHITLTAKMHKARMAEVMDELERHMPPLPLPFVLDQIALVGERPDGRFEQIARYDLNG